MPIHLIKYNKTRKQHCPVCNLLLNAASHFIEEASPAPGDLSICGQCKTVLTFDDAMDLRLATQQEIATVENELATVTHQLEQSKYSLFDTPNGPAILCHQCGNSTTNPNDIKYRYCGHCHEFLGD